MRTIQTNIPDIQIFEPEIYHDERGFFVETFRQTWLDAEFVQDNHSRSNYGVLRGLHYQLARPQGKLCRVASGAVFDVAVDVRVGSPTFAKSISVILSDKNQKQIYIPPGFAHGFCALTETVDFLYKCTDYYDPKSEITLRWNDPQLNIAWPIETPALSDNDRQGGLLDEIPKFAWEPN